MITIYAPEAQDFSTLGLGALAPYECVIEEQAGGMYELTMTHPMDAEGKWLNIGVGCIVKAPAPVRETPLVESEIVGEGEATEPVTVTRKIYKVQTNTGANLHLRQGPSTSTAILSKYRPGTEVVVLSQANGWGQVIVCSSGATGYMSMQYLVYVRDETETIEGDAPGPERVVYPVQSRMQLFRIFKVERDAAEREVRVEARHIFYDLLGNVVKNEYAPEGEAADAVVEELFERALNAHDFSVHCQTARSVTGEYTRRGLVECLLDPDDGVLPQTGARLVRDNFDVWILPDATRETGVTIRHGKNLLGATLTTDWDSLVTRIIPVGQDKEGKALLLEGTTYMDSPHISDYPVICAQAVEYDVKIGQEGINNAAQARAKLQELAEADFSDNGVDLPTVGLDVDFVALGETEEYRAYADLEAVHLYDTVRVIAKSAGIDAAVRVTGYKWDALGRKYEAVTLGEIADLKTTVYGYELQRGSVKTIKIAPGAVGSAQLRELAVQYAHINTAAVEQLSANSITALKAYIHELVAGSITTDQLYADLAAIALAQITTANIENANIDWAQIGTLSADIADIAKAHLGDADINWANIANLTAAVAEIAEAKIAGATIGSAQIDDLAAVVAQLIHAEVGTGEFDLAEIENLLASAFILEQGAANSMMIKNLVVTDANLLNATIGKLVMPGDDGKYYEVTIGSDGSISTSEVTVTEGEISAGQMNDGRQIVTTTINADSINGSNVTAQQAILGTILTTALTAGKITAGEALLSSAVIPTLYTTSIQSIGNSLTFESNEMIQSIVSDVNGNAEDLTNYISSTNSELENLQGQIDGAITTWFYGVPPTNDNPPANEWTTTDQKNIHLGDLYYDTITGYCYRWQVQNNQYSWQRITDTDVTKALQDAEKAQDTADSKRRVFVSQPVPPYEVGDLWVQGSTGDILRCQTAKTSQQSYSSSDWVRASKYTDDTAADAAQATANANTTAIGSLNTRVTQAETSITQTQNKIELMASEIETELEDIRSDTDFATPYISATPPETAPEAGKLWLDEGVEPSVLRKWRGADVTTEREYTETRVGCGKNLLRIPPALGPATWEGTVEVSGDGYTVSVTGSGAWAQSEVVHLDVIPGKTYTASVQSISGGNAAYVAIQDGPSGGSVASVSANTPNLQIAFAAPSDGIRVVFVANGSGTALETPTTAVFSGVMIEEGNTAAEYEPYEDIPSLALDNGAGQMQRVAVEAGCRTRQAGTGEPSPENIRAITGRDSVEIAACGKNLLRIPPALGPATWEGTVEVSGDGYTVSVTGSGAWAQSEVVHLDVIPGKTYTASVQSISGGNAAYVAIQDGPSGGSVASVSANTPNLQIAFAAPSDGIRVVFVANGSGTALETPTTAVFSGVMIAEGNTAAEYEPYRSMGGGTVTPTEPLYGLPGAEDTVEVSVDGDVTVTRRTGYIASYNGESLPGRWTSSHDVYAEGATPTTGAQIVYELAAPEMEALTAISPIAPQPGQLNLFTDADALTATIHGSGWETVNDTSSIQDALANLDGDLASLINEVGLLNGEVGSIAQQIISPDGIKNIVFDSTEYQAMANTVEVNANELSVTQTTVTDINGRVETIEGTVRISGSNIDIGRSDSNVQLHLDNTGWSISEGGQETIYARQNRVVAPRFQTTSLIFGALAFNSSGGHFRLMKYGG